MEPSRKPLARSWALSNKDWDEKLDLEPRVCHCLPTIAGDLSARTGLAFRLVCRAIRAVAFEQTDLPLIISLEDHTTGEQHEEMVKIMKEEWAGVLLENPLPGCDPETQQPRVADLKGKILIKGKRKTQKVVPGKPPDSGSPRTAMLDRTTADQYYGVDPEERQVKEGTVDYALNKLAIYTYSAGPFKSLNSKDAQKPAHIFSFSEEKLKALHRTKHKDVFQHNKKYLARTFPASLLSANPNFPTLSWRKGVQMVSLNWQHWDAAMHLNDAMFDDTHGWVLKPEGYQSDSSASCQAHVPRKKKLSLRVTILAGQNIPMPRAAATDDSSGKLIPIVGTPPPPSYPSTSSTRNKSPSTSSTRNKSPSISSTRNKSPSISSTAGSDDSDVRVVPAVPEVHDIEFRPRVKCYLHVESKGERNPNMRLSDDEICLETKPAETRHPTWPEDESRLDFPVVSHVVEELSFLRYVRLVTYKPACLLQLSARERPLTCLAGSGLSTLALSGTTPRRGPVYGSTGYKRGTGL